MYTFKPRFIVLSGALFCTSCLVNAQHDHQKMDMSATDAHLQHIQACRKEIVYIDSLAAPVLMDGIGTSTWKIITASDTTQRYFNQGIALLHCFWDLEAYRSFKTAIQHDTTAIMPYWGMYMTIGHNDNPEFKRDGENALAKMKLLKDSANEKERLCVEALLAMDDKGDEDAGTRKWEALTYKYPDEIDLKLFFALQKMSGFDEDMAPRDGHLYARYILKDLLEKYPENAGANHYWIHVSENCCPEDALAAAIKLTKLAPRSGHMVHMPGHIYYRMGNYKLAYEAFTASMRVDSAYMKDQGIQEVDAWNYIHNINYLLGNCVEDGRYTEALRFAEKLKNLYVDRNRKKAYQSQSFFYQGVMAPAVMELRFGFYDRAVMKLEAITNLDTIYKSDAMQYKQALTLYARGMDALNKNKLSQAIDYSYQLDGFLWRNQNQGNEDLAMNNYVQKPLKVASLELQGLIKSYQGNYEEAMSLLKEARKAEDKLGYSEPPAYHRPILMSIAATQIRAKKYDDAIASYETLLKQYPNCAKGLYGMVTVYKLKGDKAMAASYADKLKNTVRFGDKALYAVKN